MRTCLIVVTLLTTFVTFSQDKPDFKKEVITFFEVYEHCIQAMGKNEKNDVEIKTAKKAFREVVSSPYLRVPNDLNKEANDSLLPLNQYLYLLENNFPSGYEMKLNLVKMDFEDLHIDKSRNSYRLKATVTKRFVEYYVTVSDPMEIDTLNTDSTVSAKPSYDTTFVKNFTNLTFYFTTSIEFGKYTPLKLEAIQVASKTPEYAEPLSELTTWWVGLSDPWKNKLSEELKFPEVPSDYFLQRIHGVEKIDLSGVKVNDWSVLEQLKGVKELDLSNLGLDTLIMLKNMTGLRTLNVSNNKLRSLHGLEKCVLLESLNFSGNEVVDLSPIADCQNLLALQFNNNKVVDISTVKNFAHLRALHLSNNEVADLSPIKTLRIIRNLDVSKNKKIESIEPISQLIMMEKLDIYNTQAGSLEAVRNMSNLLHLDAGYSKIHSLDPIKNFKLLGYLNIAGNPIDDFSALNNLDRIRKLYLGSVKISDISPIMKMENIRVLHAPHTNFSKEDIQRFKKKFPKCEITYY